MAKSTALNFTQNLNNVGTQFNASDPLCAVQVVPNAVGTNLTAGTRTFTAAGGTTVTGGAGAATWTATVKGGAGAGSVYGPCAITQHGEYKVGAGPTAANSATVDSGSSDASFTVTVGILKTLYTASANDAVVKAINVSSTDTTARIMTLWQQDAGSTVLNYIGAINIPASAGTGSGTTASIDLLGGTLLPSLPYDANGKRVIPLKAGTVLMASVPTVAATFAISVSTMVEEY